MALCDLCRTIPFSNLPPPPSTFDGVSHVGNNSELITTWSADHQGAGFPWHENLDALADSARSQCPICSVVQAAVHDWLVYYDEIQRTKKLKEISTFDEAPRDSKLWVTRRYNDASGFIVAGRHLSSKSRSTNILASIGFTADATSAGPRGLLPTTDVDSGSLEGLQFAAKWLEECVDGHAGCDKIIGTLPTRVLDVDFSDDMVKLVKTNTHHSGLYVALSYCWGSPLLNLTTTRASYEARTAGIPLSQLPKMFRDAVIIARHLQIRYLWIDSLCIIQGDSEDWAHEASRMKSVYSGAHIVIAADHPTNPTEGCFHIRDPLSNVVVEIPGVGTVRAQVLCRSDELSSHTGMFATEPLSQRTWALQERVMARRVLHYATKQLYFECNQGLLSESGGRLVGGRLGDLDKPQQTGSHVKDALRSWHALVTAVSKRKLTNATDKLPSMAGLASLIGPEIGGEYVAGLWSNALIRGLEWASRPAPKLESSGPSWSWAGHGGPALYFTGNTEPVAKIDSWGLELKNKQNAFGEVKEAWIRLRGPVVHLRVSNRHGGIGNENSSPLIPRVITPYSSGDEEVKLDDVEALRSGLWSKWDMYLLGLTKMSVGQNGNSGRGLALILMCLGNDQSAKMKRVGYMFWDSKLESSILADETCYETITLV